MPLPPPEKFKTESTIEDFFVNGDKGNIARLMHKDASTISRQLSPNQEHNNHIIYFFLLVLWACDCIRRELGDAVMNLVLTERAKWNAEESLPLECTADLTENVGVQFSEFAACRMKGKSADEQIAEAADIEIAAAKLKANLIRERNHVLYNSHVDTSVREMMRPAVETHRNGKK